MIEVQTRAKTLRMAEKQTLGILSVGELRDLATRSEIDAVWAVTPDQYGRPVGKRFGAKFFVDEVLDRQADLPARLLFKDIGGGLVQPPSTVRVDPSANLGCRPDVTALRRATWLERTAIAICDVVDLDTEVPHVFSPRAALKRQLERARSASVSARASYDLGFYLRDDRAAVDAAGAGAEASEYRALHLDRESDPVFEMQQLLRSSGIPIEAAHSAAGTGQHRLALHPAGLLDAADRALILKWLVKEVARKRSRSATFMALPSGATPASTMEIHMSLWSSDREAALFAGKDSSGGEVDLPPACRWWLGGLLRSARESTLLFAPTVNSYKRFHADDGAGSAIGWSRDRHVAGFRVSGDGAKRRVSCSLAGSDANPYLVGAVLLAAGLEGMSSRSELAAEAGREASAIRALPEDVARDRRGGRPRLQVCLRSPDDRRAVRRVSRLLRALGAGALRCDGQLLGGRAVPRRDMNIVL